MADFMIIVILAVVVAAAARYIYKAKKSGVKCIGCPSGKTCGKQTACSGSCASCSGCSHHS